MSSGKWYILLTMRISIIKMHAVMLHIPDRMPCVKLMHAVVNTITLVNVSVRPPGTRRVTFTGSSTSEKHPDLSGKFLQDTLVRRVISVSSPVYRLFTTARRLTDILFHYPERRLMQSHHLIAHKLISIR